MACHPELIRINSRPWFPSWLAHNCLEETADQIVGSGTRPASTVLEHGPHLRYRPAFAGGYHADLSTLAYQRVRTHLVVDADDREVRLRLPIQGEVEVTREDLPSRTVVQLDDVALGMGSDLHRISRCAAECAGFPERRSPLPARCNRPPS